MSCSTVSAFGVWGWLCLPFSWATLAGALFAVGVVLHSQAVAEKLFGTIDLLGALFIGLGGSE